MICADCHRTYDQPWVGNVGLCPECVARRAGPSEPCRCGHAKGHHYDYVLNHRGKWVMARRGLGPCQGRVVDGAGDADECPCMGFEAMGQVAPQAQPPPPADAKEWTCPVCGGDALWCGHTAQEMAEAFGRAGKGQPPEAPSAPQRGIRIRD